MKLFVLIILLTTMTGFNAKSQEDINVATSTGSTFFIDADEFPKLISAAQNGELFAAVRLYKHYKFSTMDSEKAFIWLTKAAELGDRVSQYNLSHFYLQNGQAELAEEWALRALENGLTEASELLNEINNEQR